MSNAGALQWQRTTSILPSCRGAFNGDDCIIPKAGFEWKTTRMPIVLELWDKIAQSMPPAGAPLDDSNNLNAQGKAVLPRRRSKSKGSELKRIIELPRRVEMPLHMTGMEARMPRWNASPSMAGVSWTARKRRSRPSAIGTFSPARAASFPTAKHVYVATRSGWFSCRSACYLAAGRRSSPAHRVQQRHFGCG